MDIKIMASAAVVSQNKLLVLKRSAEEKFLSGYWTIVGGKYEDGDKSIEDAVKREVMEETGLKVDIIKPINVEEFTREDKPGVIAVEITYLCRSESNGEIKLSSHEHDSYAWISESGLTELNPVTELTKQKIKKIFSSLKTN